jgi:hypothetical protein
MDSVTFFGAKAEGPDEEQAALPPGGALADAVLVAYVAAAEEQHAVCVAQPLVARLLRPTACKAKGGRGKSPSMVGCYLPKGEKLACRAVDLLCD